MNPPLSPPPLTSLTEQRAVFEIGWPTWVLVGIAAVAVALLVLGYLNVRRAPPRRRAVLVGLRSAVVLLAVTMLLQPAIQRREVVRVRNVVPVLIDGSASMGLQDQPGEPSRAQQVSAWLGSQKEELARLAGSHQLHFFTFGEDLQPAESQALAAGYAADQQETHLLEALEEVAQRVQVDDLGGIIVVSDGLDNGTLGRRMVPGRPLDGELKERLQALGAPLHTFLAGQAGGLVDLAVQRVQHDEFAFVHNALDVDVDLLATGVSGGAIDVLLAEEGTPLQTRPLQLEPGRSRYRVTFSFTPARVGKHHYRVSLPHLRGETILANNQQDFLINVLRDRVRVLQVVGRPSWDERFLRDLLKKSPNVDLISFFILRTATNLHVVPSSELSLIPFPSQELFEKELGGFDVVIFQNFDYRPYQMRRYLPYIRDYVLGGGALAMVGGELSFSAGGYGGTALAAALPVALPAGGGEQEQFLFGTFPLKLTEAGRRHPIMALSPDREENLRLWARLPELEGANRIAGPLPGSVVLATTPGGSDPLIVAGPAGRGRSLAVLTDSTWRWTLPHVGQGGDLRHYTRFWGNAIRWLIQDPEQKQLTVTTDRDRYPSQAEVRAEVRLLDGSYRPAANTTVRLLRQASAPRPTAAAAPGQPAPPLAADAGTELVTDAEGRATWTFPAGAPGVWRVSVSADVEEAKLTDETLYLAGVTSRELQDVAPREDLLATLASVSQGTFHKLGDTLADLPLRPPRVLRVHRQESQPLWNHAGVLLVALALLTLEWWLRRRWGFL